jgi:hypothetical protein
VPAVLGSLEVDDQLEFVRQQDRKVSRFAALVGQLEIWSCSCRRHDGQLAANAFVKLQPRRQMPHDLALAPDCERAIR